MGNIIPATTGAAQAVVKVLPELAGKFHGEPVPRSDTALPPSLSPLQASPSESP
jgi:hypothetical protein